MRAAPGNYADYFEALVWAMVIFERWPSAADVRVTPVDPDTSPEAASIPKPAA